MSENADSVRSLGLIVLLLFALALVPMSVLATPIEETAIIAAALDNDL